MNQNEFSMDYLRTGKSKPHIHEGMECVFVISGSIELELGGKRYHMAADDIVVINLNQVHAIHGNSSALLLSLYVEKDYLLKECPEMARCSICCNSADAAIANDQRYTELKKTLIQLKLIDAEKAYGYELNMRILFLRFIYVLLINFKAAQTREDSSGSLESAPELSAVLQYMYQNYYMPISLKNMADLAFMSPHYFSKYFKKRIGESFSHYLQKIRIDNAMKSLLYGNDSILRIALDNGFANPKTFSAAFVKQYQYTPSAYRKRYKNVEIYKCRNDSVKSDEIIEGDITELLRYGKKYDLIYEQEKPAQETLAIGMKGGTKRLLKRQAVFLNIGKADAALGPGFINNLRMKYDLGIQYVYFCPWDRGAKSRITRAMFFTSWNYHILQVIDIFHAVNLVPVFKINCEAAKQNEPPPHMRDPEIIGKLLEAIVGHYPRQYSEKWMFEICLENMSADQAMLLYQEIYLIIKKKLPLSPVGLYSVPDDRKENLEMFAKRLSLAVLQDCRPDFISFSVFPNSLKDSNLSDITHYPVKGYHKKVAMAVKNVCEKLGCGSLPTFMINWNTITGSNQSELNVYFRSALILQALMDLNEFIDGIGFWYDTADSYFSSEEDYAVSLALYTQAATRRPVYSVLESFIRLGSTVLWESDNAIATYKDEEAEWVILVWNPSYLNPFYCTSQKFIDGESKTVRLEITGLNAGKYQFKRFCIERGASGSLSQYISSGFPDCNDKDAYEYLQMAANKQMMVFEEKITGGAYTITSDISMNGVLMLVIKQIG